MSKDSTSNEPIEKNRREREVESTRLTPICLMNPSELVRRGITNVKSDLPIIFVGDEITIFNIDDNIMDGIQDIQERVGEETMSLILEERASLPRILTQEDIDVTIAM